MANPQTSFKYTKFHDSGFISKRRKTIHSTTILYQLQVLKDTGRYDAFKLKWHSSYNDEPNVWPVPNHLFWDSDIAKWIEGACYYMFWEKNQEVELAIQELVGMIATAQQPDGYLNIHFTVVEPQKRFTNLRDLHELYNAGHLIEAAIAHNDYYGNNLLLDPILKYVDLIFDTFGSGPNQIHGYPGHPEIELALLRLYQKTQNLKHLELAHYFISERGNPTGDSGKHFYEVEAERRGEDVHVRPAYYTTPKAFWYQQAHLPITEQQTIEGHSVRAMYLLTALADLIRIDGSKPSGAEKDALFRLWENMVNKKMYITGGIGAIKQYEGFGIDYFLPQGSDDGGCYSETCAAIGVMMLAERLLQLDLDGKYADIMELCFYNSVTTGMSACGKKFTYVNQLASSNTDLSKRADWFNCACCPPNVTRLLGYMGGYLWTLTTKDSKKEAEIVVHLYSSAALFFEAAGKKIQLEQTSDWPWNPKIDFVLTGAETIETTVLLRIPGWAKDWKISPPLPQNAPVEKGYLKLSPAWLAENPQFALTILLETRMISPHASTNQDVVAVARGPVVYCLEDADNTWVDDHFKTLHFDPSAKITTKFIADSAMNESYVGLVAHNAGVISRPNQSGPSQDIRAPSGSEAVVEGLEKIEELNFTPYCLRDNRGGKGHMRVGLRILH